MIPIIYEYDEAAWTSNGLGRLYDCLTAEVTEERNGVYEAEFTYPVSGANFDLIKKGRIVALTHDDSGVVQPFQIVAITRPIDGIVTFRAVHISYRLNGAVAVGSDIGSMAAALNLVNNASPDFGFTITSDITSTELLPIADGIPKTVRQIINGGEGSILDTYGGEIECDGWTVYIHSNRGVPRDFTIRYGINMTEYQDVEDWDGTYNSVLPYYAKNDVVVVGPPQYVNHASSWTGRTIRVPLDVTAECGDTVPGTGTVGIIADRIINQKRPDLPLRNMTVDFVRLQDFAEYQDVANLYTCRLCDTVNVSFPEYGTTGAFKVVKTVWDALGERYLEMELGNLSTTLSDALGISATASSGGSGGGGVQSVTVTPALTSGTKVADIEVDGETSALYAPTPPTWYGTCSTAAATAAKVVTLADSTGWSLDEGVIIGVKFTATNTAQNPTLNVNSSGAKHVYYNSSVVATSNLNKVGYANRITYFMYDGTNWVWMGWSVDDNTTYSSMSVAEYEAGTGTTARLITPARLKAAIAYYALLISDKYTRSNAGDLDWTSTTEGDTKAIMKSALAFWNGAYSGTNSNLRYSSAGQIIGRNQICYANSRVDTFSNGEISIPFTSLGITTGARPVGILLTPEYSSDIVMHYMYDNSSSNVVIRAWKAGTAYSGALRYFAVVFQNTWTSV